MLGAFRRSRDYSPASSTASDRATPVANGDWQTFCREEGKKAAREFLRRLKDYRERHPDVSEPCCVREFATSLTELLSASCSDLRKSRTVPSPPKPTASSNSKPTKQQWWKIFKRSKSLRHKDSPSRSTGDMIDSNHPGLVLDRVVSQMNLSDSDSCGKWEKCRLVLINRQGNYQLEIYSPPKVRKHTLLGCLDNYVILKINNYVCVHIHVHTCIKDYISLWDNLCLVETVILLYYCGQDVYSFLR